jgi:hypothetical protein
MRRAAAKIALAALLLAASSARAAEPEAFKGTWTATNAAKQAFGGTWTADVAVATPNVALGTWTMLNQRGDELMRGTWSARHEPRGWRGAWSARVGGTNQVVSGTWEADDSTLKGAKTFRDMLARTAQKQIAGVWHMGHAHGNWWIAAR